MLTSWMHIAVYSGTTSQYTVDDRNNRYWHGKHGVSVELHFVLSGIPRHTSCLSCVYVIRPIDVAYSGQHMTRQWHETKKKHC